MNYSKSKKYIILLEIIITVLFTACQTSEDKQYKKVHFEPYIISTEEDAENNLLDAALYDDLAYLVSPNNIITYDLISGKRTVVAYNIGNTAICVNKDYIYTYNKEQNAIIKFNKKGDIIKLYPCSFERVDANFISVLEDMVVIEAKYTNGDGNPESELYKLNLSDGKSSRISDGFKSKDTYSFILSLDFIDKNTIMITSSTVISFSNPIMKGYKFDVQKEKVLDEFIIPSNHIYTYNSKKQCFYYFDTKGYDNNGNINIKEYYPETGIDITLSTIDNDTLTTLDNNMQSLHPDKMFNINDNVIFWSLNNNCFLITDQATEEEPLNVILTEGALDGSRFSLIIKQFEAEYGYPVRINEYPEDIYKDKLRTKLLAGDSDYDIFLIGEASEDNLLSSILKYELFEPLDNYDDITNNFAQMYDGVRTMMSYNNKLFGIPYSIMYANSKALNNDFKKYGYTIPGKQVTNDDIWKLCDEIIKSGEQNVTVFKNVDIYNNFVSIFLQEAINKNDLDKNALTDLLKIIKKYIDAGVLSDYGDLHKESSEKIHLMESSVNYFFGVLGYEIPAYPELGTVLLSSNDKKNYLVLNGCVFINKFSNKKELAAKLLKVMTDSKNIYNTKVFQFVMLGSDLTKYDKYNEWSPDRIDYLSDLPYIYNNAAIYTHISNIADLIRNTITPGFFDGSISPEEAANMIYDQINYTYFE